MASTLEFLVDTGRAKANLDELQKTMQQTRDKAINTDAMKAATLQQVAADKDHVKVLGDKLAATKNMKAATQEALMQDKAALEVLGKAKLAQENYGRAVKESFNAIKQQSLVLKDVTAAEQKYADTLDKVNKAELSLNDAAKRMNESAVAIYQQRQKMLAQNGSYSKMTKEQKKEYDDLTKAQQAALNSMDEFADAQARMQMELRDSGAKMTAYAQGIGQVGANLGSMMGAFGEFGKVPGMVATQVGQMVGQFDKLGEMQGPEKMMASMNLALAGAQMLMQIVGSIDEGIRKAEQAVIDTGKNASKDNLSIESFNLGNKSLTDRIDLVNKLAETNPKMAASLRGAIGSEKEFEEATRKAQAELKGLRQEGMSMEWKTEQTGGGLLGWLKSANSSIGSTAAQMGNFLVAMEDFRNGTATAMSQGAESLKSFASSADGLKNRALQMDIQIAEKQGDINKSHDLQIDLISQEGEQLQKNLNLTILTLKAQQDQNRVSGGEAQTALANQRQILTADIAKLGGKFSNQIMQWVLNSVKETSVAAEDIFNKGTKTWQEWDKMLREIRSQDEGVYTKLWQSGAFEAASKAFITMARGAKEIGEGNAGLAATIKELEGAYSQVPGLVGQIIDRQKILWSLEKDGSEKAITNLQTIINWNQRWLEIHGDIVISMDVLRQRAADLQAGLDKIGLDPKKAGLRNLWQSELDYVNAILVDMQETAEKSIENLRNKTRASAVEATNDIIASRQKELDLAKGIKQTDEEIIATRLAAAGYSEEYINTQLERIKGIKTELAEINKIKSMEDLFKNAGAAFDPERIIKWTQEITSGAKSLEDVKKEIDAINKGIDEAKAKDAARLNEAEKTYDNIVKKLQDNALKIIDEKEFQKVNEFHNKMLDNIPKIAGVTDDLFDKLKTDWEAVNRKIFDTTKQLEDERDSFEIALNEKVKAGKITMETAKLWLEEYDKMMMDTLAKEDAKRKDIIREYADGLNKALKSEEDKLTKMLDDYNKRLLDREKQTQDAKLKLNDYVYRQTHTAEENAVRDAVANYQKEYEEFRKAGVAKEDLAQWQALKQKELTQNFTAQQKAAFEAQKKAAIESTEAIVKAAQEAWDKETKKQRDEINAQIDLVNQLRQAALDAKNILLELLGQPVDTRQAAVTPKLGETPTGSAQSTSGKEPPLSYGAGLGIGGNVTWNGIVWKWNGRGWDFVKYVDNKGDSGSPILGGGIKGGALTPGDIPREGVGNSMLKGIVDNAIGLTKDGAIQTAIGNAFGQLGLGQIAGKSFVDTFKESLVGKDGNGGLAAEAPGYAKRIVELLSKGITDNVGLLRDAVDKLTLEISLQLEPHSPPKEGRLHTIDKWMPKIVGLLTKGVLTDSDVRKPFYILADKIASSLGVGLDYGIIQAARQFKSSYTKNMSPLIASIETSSSVYGNTLQSNPASSDNPAYALWENQKKQLLEYQAFEAALSIRPGSGLNWSDYEAGGKYADTEMAKIFSKNREFDIQNGTDGKIGLGTNMAKGLLESSWFKALTPKLTDRQIADIYGQFGKQNMPNYNAFAGYDLNELGMILSSIRTQDDGNDSYWKLLNRIYYSMRELPTEVSDTGKRYMDDRFKNFEQYQGVNFRDMLTTKFAQQYQITDPKEAETQYVNYLRGQRSIDAMKESGAWGTQQSRPAAMDTEYVRGYDDWSRAMTRTGAWNGSNFVSYDDWAKGKRIYTGDSAYIKLAKDRMGYIDKPSSLTGVSDLTASEGGRAGNIYYVSININGDNLDSEQIAERVVEKLGETGDIYA